MMNGRQAIIAKELHANVQGDSSRGGLDARCVGSTADSGGFSCPVCGADQIPAEECRRCHADLALCLKLQIEVDEKRVQCLALIRQRRLLRATQMARECLELSTDQRNTRLLASCYLLQGDFASALLTLAKAG